MLAFYFILLGCYLFYCRSKYFPKFLPGVTFPASSWLGVILLSAGIFQFASSNGWVAGILIALAAASLGITMLQFFAVLGRRYFYSFVAVIHLLLLFQIVNHAR